MLLLATLAFLAGCAAESTPVTSKTSSYKPADAKNAAADSPDAAGSARGDDPTANASSQAGKAGKAAVASTAATGNVAAPEGDLPTLLRHIDTLSQRQPQGKTQDEQLENFVRTQQERLATAEKALTMDPNKETKQRLYQVMYEIYRLFDRFQVPGSREQLVAFGTSLSKEQEPEFARMGRYMLFDINIGAIASRPLESGQPIVNEIKKLLDAELKAQPGTIEPSALDFASQTVDQVLLANGLKADAVAALNAIADAAAADPKLAKEAADYRDRAKLVETDLGTVLTDVVTDEKDAETKLLETLTAILPEVQPSQQIYSELRQVVQVLEVTGHLQAAGQVYDLLEQKYVHAENKDAIDPKIAEAIQSGAAALRKRLALIGQPFTVEGVTLDGQPFDWSAYQGKVVLVDFWATWCVPCLEEIPNIRRNYEQFQSKGFEVVGVNLNTNIDEVRQFFALQELPWPSVTSQVVLDEKADPNDFSALPMADKYGVDSIPFLVLVGQDGKVDSLHVRGEKLRVRLTQLLGEPATTEIPADPAAAPADAVPPAESPPPAPAANDRGATAPGGALFVAHLLFAADEVEGTLRVPTTDDAAINPYQAKPGLSTAQLVATIEKMLDKPKTIQARDGFGAAVVEACDRVLAADPPAKEGEFLFAAETKFQTLHRLACDGDESADKQLMTFVAERKDDARPRIARHVKLCALERRVLDGEDLPLDQVPALLKEVEDYVAQEKLDNRHLRLASSTVALINRLEDGDVREAHFAKFGGTFAKSSDNELARYGKKLAKKPQGKESDLVGKPLELAGATASGAAFAWEAYRGKVVLVDFWATWCGPCRKEMPNVQALYEKLNGQGLEVVGISLDEDQEALAQYLEENAVPWETLAGEGTQQLAEKYGVRGIPTMILVDKSGKVLAVAHNVAALAPLAEKQLR